LKYFKGLLTAALLQLAFTGGQLAEAADIPDEQYSMGNRDSGANHSSDFGVYYQDSIRSLQTPTLLMGFDPAVSTIKNASICTSLDDKACASQNQLNFKTFLGRCQSPADVNCIESVYAIDPKNGLRIDGKLKFTMPTTILNPFKGDATRGIPDSENPSIWSLPGVPNSGGSEDYAVLVEVSGDIVNSRSLITNSGFSASIFPVSLMSDSRYKRWISEVSQNGRPGTSNGSQLSVESCAIVDNGLCAMRQSFPVGIEYGMAIRFSKTINGWLHGRLNNPTIDYELKPFGTRIALQGRSVKVPVVAGYVSADKVTSLVKSQIGYIPEPGGTVNPGAYYSENFSVWNNLLGDKAVASPSQWIFYSLTEDNIRGANDCIKNSPTLAGFITTNSTTYYAGPPVFNRDTQTLDYKVASPHYLKDGSVFQGEYNLYIDSKVARCIYQFSSAPIGATISIMNETGESKVATTTVQESGGWIHLMAVGFTFSNPTLKVKLTQERATAPISQLASPAKSITCVKGKATKKVTGMKPTCPNGYTKK